MPNSSLFDETTFYQQFIRDLRNAKQEVIIESPFITGDRMALLYPAFEDLINRGIKVFVMTRDPKEHYHGMEVQSEAEIRRLEEMGIQVLLCLGNHHRKLAIIDRKILWEGSLNILSHSKSREIMRRFSSPREATRMFDFLRWDLLI